jgi:hypothetical protein
MSSQQQATPAQRQQAAQQWREFAPTHGMQPAQVEEFAQRLLNGQQDRQVLQYLARTEQPQSQPQQQQQPQPQYQQHQYQPPPPPQQTGGFSFQTPFGNIQIPIPPTFPMGFPQFPGFQPAPFAANINAPAPVPRMIPFTSFPPFGAAMAPFPEMLPSVPNMQPAMPAPTSQTSSFTFPGGGGNTTRTNFSSRSGNATFSYSSSSTNASWGNPEGAQHAGRALGVPGFQSFQELGLAVPPEPQLQPLVAEQEQEQLGQDTAPQVPPSSYPAESFSSSEANSGYVTPPPPYPGPPSSAPAPAPDPAPDQRHPSASQANRGFNPFHPNLAANSSPSVQGFPAGANPNPFQQAANTESQNPRLQRAFAEQFQNDGNNNRGDIGGAQTGETYFSFPAGAPDRAAETTAAGEEGWRRRSSSEEPD